MTPRPRKLSVEAVSAACAMDMEICTMIGEMAFGTRWRMMMRPVEQRMMVAASIYLLPRIWRMLARMSRAKGGMNEMPMARMLLPRPVPSTVATAMALTRPGKDWSTSSTRISTASSVPPK